MVCDFCCFIEVFKLCFNISYVNIREENPKGSQALNLVKEILKTERTF